MKITNHVRGIYRIYPNFIKENRRMSTCTQLDLQTLGSQPIMPKNPPNRWSNLSKLFFVGYKANLSSKNVCRFVNQFGVDNNI